MPRQQTTGSQQYVAVTEFSPESQNQMSPGTRIKTQPDQVYPKHERVPPRQLDTIQQEVQHEIR